MAYFPDLRALAKQALANPESEAATTPVTFRVDRPQSEWTTATLGEIVRDPVLHDEVLTPRLIVKETIDLEDLKASIRDDAEAGVVGATIKPEGRG